MTGSKVIKGDKMKEVRARVILQEKGLYTINYDGNDKYAEVSGKYRHEANTVSDYPAVGDYVLAGWSEDDSNAVISAIYPRKSVFIRKAAGNSHQEQVVAANIDMIFICMSLNRDFNMEISGRGASAECRRFLHALR